MTTTEGSEIRKLNKILADLTLNINDMQQREEDLKEHVGQSRNQICESKGTESFLFERWHNNDDKLKI